MRTPQADWYGQWRVVEEVFLAPEYEEDGRPVFAEYEEHAWSEAEKDAREARRGWRLIDVTMPNIVIDGEEQPNAHYDPAVA